MNRSPRPAHANTGSSSRRSSKCMPRAARWPAPSAQPPVPVPRRACCAAAGGRPAGHPAQRGHPGGDDRRKPCHRQLSGCVGLRAASRAGPGAGLGAGWGLPCLLPLAAPRLALASRTHTRSVRPQNTRTPAPLLPRSGPRVLRHHHELRGQDAAGTRVHRAAAQQGAIGWRVDARVWPGRRRRRRQRQRRLAAPSRPLPATACHIPADRPPARLPLLLLLLLTSLLLPLPAAWCRATRWWAFSRTRRTLL